MPLKQKRICQNIDCGKTFYRNKGKFCSHKCANVGINNPMHGRHHSDETKQKMREHHYQPDVKGEKNPMFGRMSGNDNPMKQSETVEKVRRALKGRSFTLEHRTNLSISHKGLISGENNPMKIPEVIVKRSGENHHMKLPENRAKLSMRLKGRKVPWLMGNKNPMKNPEIAKKVSNALKGRIFSSEHCTNIANAKKGHMRGNQNPRWNGGSSFEPYCPEFNSSKKEFIRDKFNRKCIVCGLFEEDNITKTGKKWKLSVHHIHYDKEEGCNGKDMILVPLCMHCHSETNNNRNKWIEYFIKVI